MIKFVAYSYDDPDEASVIYMENDFYELLDFCRNLSVMVDPERHDGPVIYMYEVKTVGDTDTLCRGVRIGRSLEMEEV
jgi:hypothetical protein